VSAPKQQQDQRAVISALFLHEGEGEAPDFTEGVLFVKVQDLCPFPLWELDDSTHA
jgi:hypothetical protein